MSLNPRGVISQAMIHLGELQSNGQPTADQMTDAMTALNTLKRSLFGTVIGTRLGAQAATGTTQQGENGGEYAIPAAAFTLTAPLNPSSGCRFGVVDANLNFGTNTCIIARNGRLMEGSPSNLALVTNGDNRRWWFRGDTGNWIGEADYVTPNDVIEFPDSLIAYLPFMLAVVIAPQYGADIPTTVAQADAQGRAAFARAYARRGRFQFDPAFGMAQQAQPQGQQG